jgi:HEAT repeat protein
MNSTKKGRKISDPEILIAAHRDACYALAAMGKGAVPSLIQALKRSDDLVRWEAAKGIMRD